MVIPIRAEVIEQYRKNIQGNDCLYHEDIGIKEFFLKAFEISRKEEDLKISKRIMANVLADKKKIR